jgi:AAA15 family ATPase/GTPase
MSTNFFLKSISVDNYRGLRKLKIDKLRRVNIIGGFNGTGKTTLLDLIFLFFDRRNMIALLRPYVTKGLQLPFPGGLDYVLGDKTRPAVMKLGTSRGSIDFSLKWETPPATMSIGASPSNQAVLTTPSTQDPDQKGIHIILASENGNEEAACIVQANHESINYNIYRQSNLPLAPATYLSATSRSTPTEDAQRLSTLVKERREDDITKALQFVNPELSKLLLLQDGNQANIYAEMKNGSRHQVAMLGGGFQSVLSIVLIMMTTRDGVVLFDEVDATIHYSKLEWFWNLIVEFADKNNCQVFAVTHSRECVAGALAGAKGRERLSDLQYIRLENDDGDTDSIIYSGEELASALNSGWEIR